MATAEVLQPKVGDILRILPDLDSEKGDVLVELKSEIGITNWQVLMKDGKQITVRAVIPKERKIAPRLPDLAVREDEDFWSGIE